PPSAAAQNSRTRAEFIDDPAFDRYHPGFGQHEDRESDLNGGTAPAMFCGDRIDEQRPTVLQVGNHRHGDDAEDQLTPTEAVGASWRISCLIHFCLSQNSQVSKCTAGTVQCAVAINSLIRVDHLQPLQSSARLVTRVQLLLRSVFIFVNDATIEEEKGDRNTSKQEYEIFSLWISRNLAWSKNDHCG